ncbi:uncharacterized protein LOC134196536 [Corticium candelabrum]|uniref:uncharacterized protein LOC134196536 n=1 Tax=Corticium candelabrum TaxID=121492 RepID=UPI002E25BBE1|nr:uncharacterized protein LOC134196536 [Corticium candelabrum]
MPIVLNQTPRDGAFLGLFVGDALAMPVHWYYDAGAIKRDYNGWLTGYKAPNHRHPSSMIAISSTTGGGRKPPRSSAHQYPQVPVVGKLILHDKLKFWTKAGESIHYHQGLDAGDNTLNALCALQVAQALKSQAKHTADITCRAAALEAYVKFMTTPGTHGDTYAESFHRAFFKDWDAAGRPTKGEEIVKFAERRFKRVAFSGKEDSHLATIGALVMALPFLLRSLDDEEDVAVRQAVDWVMLTNPAPSIIPHVELYAQSLHRCLHGADARYVAKRALTSTQLGGHALMKRVESMEKEIVHARSNMLPSEQLLRLYQTATWELGSNCQIHGALKSLFFLAYMFSNNFEAGVLTNTNCGGENCHRGAALGALLGAAAVHQGQGIPQQFVDNLGSSKAAILKMVPLYAADTVKSTEKR